MPLRKHSPPLSKFPLLESPPVYELEMQMALDTPLAVQEPEKVALEFAATQKFEHRIK